MRAWRVHALGAPAEVLRLEEVEPPVPGPGALRLRVGAAALNFADDLVCRGKYQVKPDLPFTPGMEACGVVTAVGEGVEGVRVGDRVVATTALPSGALAEEAIANATNAFPCPASVDDARAAAMLVTYQTSHIALHRRAGLRAGETLLVHAGAGGVGSAAIQLGAAAGARVIATAGGADKLRLCRELGAELAIDYREEDFVAVVKEATGGRGADVIYDSVGGDTFDRSTKCIAWEGRILVIGFAGGRIADLATNHPFIKNYSVVGTYFGNYAEHAPEHLQQVTRELFAMLADGRIDPLIDRKVPLEGAVEALGDLAARRSVGKLVVVP